MKLSQHWCLKLILMIISVKYFRTFLSIFYCCRYFYFSVSLASLVSYRNRNLRSATVETFQKVDFFPETCSNRNVTDEVVASSMALLALRPSFDEMRPMELRASYHYAPKACPSFCLKDTLEFVLVKSMGQASQRQHQTNATKQVFKLETVFFFAQSVYFKLEGPV